MLSFFRAPAFEDPELGRFKRVRTVWLLANAGAGLSVSLEGGKDRPPNEVVDVARQLMREPDPVVHAATQFVQADRKAQEFIRGNGQLVCDGFTVKESGAFAVEFSLSAWPDAMLSVQFVAGQPSAVLLGD